MLFKIISGKVDLKDLVVFVGNSTKTTSDPTVLKGVSFSPGAATAVEAEISMRWWKKNIHSSLDSVNCHTVLHLER